MFDVQVLFMLLWTVLRACCNHTSPIARVTLQLPTPNRNSFAVTLQEYFQAPLLHCYYMFFHTLKYHVHAFHLLTRNSCTINLWTCEIWAITVSKALSRGYVGTIHRESAVNTHWLHSHRGSQGGMWWISPQKSRGDTETPTPKTFTVTYMHAEYSSAL